jgi:hypothetical protein
MVVVECCGVVCVVECSRVKIKTEDKINHECTHTYKYINTHTLSHI